MKETTGADFKSATEQENKKLFIETYGCQMNVADSEVIASIMQMAGYSVCDALEDADAVFMNTCSIRDNAEQKILNRLEFFHSMRKNKKTGDFIVGRNAILKKNVETSDRERMQKCVNCYFVFRLITFVRLCMTHPWHSTVFLKIGW